MADDDHGLAAAGDVNLVALCDADDVWQRGKLAGQVWRVGLMGENARLINVEALLFALHKELAE